MVQSKSVELVAFATKKGTGYTIPAAEIKDLGGDWADQLLFIKQDVLRAKDGRTWNVLKISGFVPKKIDPATAAATTPDHVYNTAKGRLEDKEGNEIDPVTGQPVKRLTRKKGESVSAAMAKATGSK